MRKHLMWRSDFSAVEFFERYPFRVTLALLIGGDSVRRNDRPTCAQGAWLRYDRKKHRNFFCHYQSNSDVRLGIILGSRSRNSCRANFLWRQYFRTSDSLSNLPKITENYFATNSLIRCGF